MWIHCLNIFQNWLVILYFVMHWHNHGNSCLKNNILSIFLGFMSNSKVGSMLSELLGSTICWVPRQSRGRYGHLPPDSPSTRGTHNCGLLLARRRRRRASIKPTLGERFLPAGKSDSSTLLLSRTHYNLYRIFFWQSPLHLFSTLLDRFG